MTTRRIKIATVIGVRPQFVKAAALSPVLARHRNVCEVLVHTGQHFDVSMSDVFFEEMGIPSPSVNLGIGGGTHGENTGRMIEAIEAVLVAERPNAVVVYGDTDSTLAAAIAAAKLGIVLAHVEAGLRSFRRAMPEEINRVLTDHASDVLYAPSATAVAHLRGEGIADAKIVLSGDVMYDVVRRFARIAAVKSTVLQELNVEAGRFHVLTLHRKENTDDRVVLHRILKGLSQSPVPIVFPVHPRTRKMLTQFDLVVPETIRVVEPRSYLDTIQLLSHARLVLTDSGGVQKEAYYVARPCVTLRQETEWTELVDAGASVLVGSDPYKIGEVIARDPWAVPAVGIYGNGAAAEAIAMDLLRRIST